MCYRGGKHIPASEQIQVLRNLEGKSAKKTDRITLTSGLNDKPCYLFFFAVIGFWGSLIF
jgi:hypothetical protein